MLKSFLVSIVLMVSLPQQAEFKKKKLTEYLSMKVNTEMRKMSEQELSQKFLGAKRPDAALTNQASIIEFTVTGSPTFWLEKDISLLKEFYDSSIPSLFDNITFSQQEIVEINGKEFAAYQFVGTPAVERNVERIPERRYTYLLYTIYRNGLVTISFSCPPPLSGKWKPIIEEMYKSIELR